ncbi:unnamed protein product [Allacma fusca]|uniref:Peptidase S1 domain-containing protein n=1 Tax=Allacma fusca TaxID=39272 RepID=A0A8J2KBH4_9HEXA|nr:unnamed protein product [Allacma fusca]
MRNLIALLFLGAVTALPQPYKDGFIQTNFQVGKGSTGDSSSVLIVGGRDAQPGEFPWQVSLQILRGGANFHNCGGIIIDETHVVSAAHCEYNGYDVVAGAHSIQENESSQQRIKALRFEPHPNFDYFKASNDVSVITLSQPLVFNDRVKPLRLAPTSANPEGQLCVNSGWGNANPSGGNPSIDPDVLQAVNLTIISEADCKRRFSGSNVDETMICAHDLAGGKGACNGDSGGPLVCSDANGPYLAGTVSWGRNPCAQAQYASVYGRVSTALDFINSRLNQ